MPACYSALVSESGNGVPLYVRAPKISRKIAGTMYTVLDYHDKDGRLYIVGLGPMDLKDPAGVTYKVTSTQLHLPEDDARLYPEYLELITAYRALRDGGARV